jgi:tetratricopeptide (TPR) repeat protein
MPMAWMLSRIARAAFAGIAALSLHAAVECARSQDSPRASEQAVIVHNPFSAGGESPHAPSGGEAQAAGRGRSSFRNPFAQGRSAPPLSIPLRPGAISRWMRPGAMIEQPSVVANAILSTMPEPPAGIDASNQVTQAAPSWDRLPPVDLLMERQPVKTTAVAVPVADDGPKPPDPVGFAPKRLTQPVWMVPEQNRDGAAMLELRPAVQVPAANPLEITPPTVDDKAARKKHDAELLLSYPPALEPVQMSGPAAKSPDMLPVIITDRVDSPDGWYADASRAAQDATTIEQLSRVIDLCQQGLLGRPGAEMADSLRKLAAWAHNRRGELLAEAGRPRESLAEFETAIKFHPNFSLALHNRGVTFAQQNRLEDALRDFDRVVALNPGLAVAFRNRAELLSSLGRMEEAVRDYDRALAQLPEDVELYRARGYALQQLGRFDRALDDLNQAIRLSPVDPLAYAQRANLAAERGDFSQAVRDLKRAVQLEPNLAEPHRTLAWLLATCSNPRFRDAAQAVEHAKQAVALSPAPDPFIYDALAAAHASAGRFDAAISAMQQALAVAPAHLTGPLQNRLAMYQAGQPYFDQPPREVRTVSHDERQ